MPKDSKPPVDTFFSRISHPTSISRDLLPTTSIPLATRTKKCPPLHPRVPIAKKAHLRSRSLEPRKSDSSETILSSEPRSASVPVKTKFTLPPALTIPPPEIISTGNALSHTPQTGSQSIFNLNKASVNAIDGIVQLLLVLEEVKNFSQGDISNSTTFKAVDSYIQFFAINTIFCRSSVHFSIKLGFFFAGLCALVNAIINTYARFANIDCSTTPDITICKGEELVTAFYQVLVTCSFLATKAGKSSTKIKETIARYAGIVSALTTEDPVSPVRPPPPVSPVRPTPSLRQPF